MVNTYQLISSLLFFIVIYCIFKLLNCMLKKPIIITIDGNIGSGKSTFIKILKKRLGENIYFAKALKLNNIKDF